MFTLAVQACLKTTRQHFHAYCIESTRTNHITWWCVYLSDVMIPLKIWCVDGFIGHLFARCPNEKTFLMGKFWLTDRITHNLNFSNIQFVRHAHACPASYRSLIENICNFFSTPGTLKTLLSLIAPDASVKELCDKGDQLLLEETSKVIAPHIWRVGAVSFVCRCMNRFKCVKHYCARIRCSKKRRKSRRASLSQPVCRWTIAFATFRQPKMTRTMCWRPATLWKSTWAHISMALLPWPHTQWLLRPMPPKRLAVVQPM